jgi:DeoR/GlpR family transcriptional regulator of sugar metabolism
MANTKALQRQEYIRSLLENQGEVSAKDLSKKLNVSIWTIRRDLNSLAERGILKRYYGGADSVHGSGEVCQLIDHNSFRVSAGVNIDAKQRIGQAAACLVQPGERVALAGGTTTLQVARALKGLAFKGEIVTNALDIALELSEEPDIHVVCTGGDLQARYHTLVGPVTERMLKLHYFDVAVVGVTGISLTHGITVNSQVDATAIELMTDHSCRTILVADRSKFGKVCFASFNPSVPVNYLVTDEPLSLDYQSYLEAQKIKLVVAGHTLQKTSALA